jgi:hypothetical protein
VFEYKVLRRVFRFTRENITGDWRKLHNEELHNIHSSPNINSTIKWRRMKWAHHIAHIW